MAGLMLRGAILLLVFSLLSSLMTFSEPASGHGAPVVTSLPPGVSQARLLAVPDLPALNAMLLEGVRQGVMLSWHGARPLVVIGQQGEPMLRFSERGVEANAGSATWQRIEGLARQDRDGEDWRPVSGSRSYGWMDPRLSRDQDQPSSLSGSPGQWRIPLRTGGDSFEMAGEFYWRSLPAAAVHERH